MAAGSPLESLREEATCPLCLEYFRDPVITDCGHNFCRACLSRWWEAPGPAAPCPQCRDPVQQGPLRPNRQLANVVEIAKRLSLQGAGGDGVCRAHWEALKLFCEEDQAPICVVCDRSRAHRGHTVLPVEEAAQEYKEKFEAHLKTLREEREKLLGWKATRERKSQEYLKQTQAKRQKIVAVFQQLRQFLEEQERLLLAQLEKLDEEIVRLQTDNVSKLAAQISCLSELMGELEGKCQKPASEFLQDVRSALSRCETGQFQQPEEISPELEERVSGFSQKTIALSETLREFKATLPSALGMHAREPLRAHRPANVTLDPDTAYPSFVLSADRKRVIWESTGQPLPDTLERSDTQPCVPGCEGLTSGRHGHTRQPQPDNPERFDIQPCVLGCEGFTSGKHCWEVEVEVGDGECWALGVARESVSRKGRISLSPKEGIWAVQWWLDDIQALTSPVTPLPRRQAPSRIRVCLDCDWGQVTFIDAGDEAPIFTFPPGSLLPGERIRPWLWLVGHQLSLCP